MQSVEVSGKTIEEATAAAAEQLGVSPDQLRVEVLQEQGSKLLGFLGGAECRIRATVVEDDADANEDGDAEEDGPASDDADVRAEISHADGSPDAIANNAMEFVRQTVNLMGYDADARIGDVSDEEVVIEIVGEEAGSLVGRHGATLDALQLLAAVVANRDVHEGARVILDAESYRERRIAMLERIAHTHADQAKEAGKEVVIKDLKPYERRIVHLALREDPEVETYSEGEGEERHLVISPKT